jgi:hypothetical protein
LVSIFFVKFCLFFLLLFSLGVRILRRIRHLTHSHFASPSSIHATRHAIRQLSINSGALRSRFFFF